MILKIYDVKKWRNVEFVKMTAQQSIVVAMDLSLIHIQPVPLSDEEVERMGVEVIRMKDIDFTVGDLVSIKMCIRDRFLHHINRLVFNVAFSCKFFFRHFFYCRYGCFCRNVAGSVSYTHLDVYKRQGYTSCRKGYNRRKNT